MSQLSQSMLESLVRPIASAHNLDLEEVEIRKTGNRQVVRVILDKLGGISLDEVAAITKLVSDKLDEIVDIISPFTLEVSSPGVDRPLTQLRHWQRNLNRLVKVERSDGKSVLGRIVNVIDSQVLLDVKGKQIELPLNQVVRAVIQVEFNR